MINLQELKQLVLDKYVVVQKHPIHDLYIYNYSQKTQYERYWTPLTIMCRGLILNSKGDIVAKGLDKFFNYEELKESEIPNESFEIFEKYDGSYICIFQYNNELIVSSRGSFTSDHAIYAKKLIDEKYSFLNNISEKQSLIFELIAPWNRIVCDYGNEDKLVLLTGFKKIINWFEKDIQELEIIADMVSKMSSNTLELAKRYDFKDYKTIKDRIESNKEGFVIRFKNGFRMKIKGEQYVKLHRIATQISSKTVWEALMNGNESFEQLLENTPDEFMGFVKDQINKLEIQYKNIYKQAIDVFGYLRDTYDISNRKNFAMHATNYGNLSGLLFGLYDSKDIKHMIWKRLEPKYEQPFKDKKIASIK